ncbi:unnamed protein product [Cylicocyclus nassatus]|uniref:Protein-tyrosine sulfotransferase n=1 Tax=Cylicocyclus nassatus TaxID=53992 RepID=A0AA36GX58_CYLNA|nr:unnamed protein product [Cylicocyclus nassatus]
MTEQSSHYLFRSSHYNDVLELELALQSTVSDKLRYNRRLLSSEEPIIFIGGIPRSGTTLLRVMLDSHEDIRCGEETHVIPEILVWRKKWESTDMAGYAELSGLSQQTIDDATSAFISELIAKHGSLAKRLCNKDPYTAETMVFLSRVFPKSKHILMIRDARAIIHSMLKRKVPVHGYNRSDHQQMFSTWNAHISVMLNACATVKNSCILVFYERLVQQTEDEARRILKFLDIPWSDDVLRHQEKIGKEVQLNPMEFSTSQVKERIYQKALTSWFDYFSDDVLENLNKTAPLLRRLGYDTSSNRPNYTSFASNTFYENWTASQLMFILNQTSTP